MVMLLVKKTYAALKIAGRKNCSMAQKNGVPSGPRRAACLACKLDQDMCCPPLIAILAPVRKAASSEAK